MTCSHAFYSALDYVFPLAEPLSTEDQERPQKRLQEDKAAIPLLEGPLIEYLKASQYLLDKEYERKQGAEARLTSILGLSSIAGTVAFGGFFLGSSGISHIQSSKVRWVITLVGCYLILQICAAILAAVRGLSRRVGSNFTISDLVSSPGESPGTFLHRKAECTLEVLSDYDTRNNQKLTQMACAHRAMRNFLGGLLVFTVLAAILATRANSSDELIDKMKKNHELNELLRGPQGPPGVAGPKGDAGPPPRVPPAKPPRRKRCPCTSQQSP